MSSCSMLFGACGSTEDSEVGPDAAFEQADADTSPRVVFAGVVVEDGSDSERAPVAGATVSIYGADEASAVTDSEGRFELMAPIGTRFVLVEADGFWGAMAPIDVPVGGVDDYDGRLFASDEEVAQTIGELGTPIDETKGVLFIDFDGDEALGGESASIGSDSGEPFSLADDEPVPGSTLPPGGHGIVFFNVAPGATSVSVSGVQGTSVCGLVMSDIDQWPVRARTITVAEVVCAAL